MLKPILITRRFLSSSSAVTVWIQIVKYKRQLRDKPPAQHRKSSLQFYRLDLLRLQSRQPREVQDAAKNRRTQHHDRMAAREKLPASGWWRRHALDTREIPCSSIGSAGKRQIRCHQSVFISAAIFRQATAVQGKQI